MKTLCFTGHRPKDLAGKEDQIKARLETLVGQAYAKGYRRFVSGMAMGVDLYAAQAVLKLQESHADVELIAAVPFPGQTAFFDALSRATWTNVLLRATQVNMFDPLTETSVILDAKAVLERNRQALQQQAWPYYQVVKWLEMRTRWMIDHSDAVLAVWSGKPKGGTANAVRYAMKLKKPILVYHPFDETLERHNF